MIWGVLTLAMPARAFACSVCMSDNAAHSLLGSGLGSKLRLADENVYIRKSQGDERHQEWRSYLGASYAATDWLNAGLTIPWVWKSLRADGERVYTRGVGDAEGMARMRVWQNRPVFPSDVWRVSAGAAVPTGNNWIRRSVAGRPLEAAAGPGAFMPQHAGEPHAAAETSGRDILVDEHSQIGTGAFVGLIGSDYQHYGDRWSWGASALGRFPLANERGFRYGISTLAGLTLSYALLHSVSLALSPIYRFAARDRTDDGLDADSGGSVIYVEPAIVAVVKPVSLRAKVAFPVATYLFGEQREYPVFSVMAAGDFLD